MRLASISDIHLGFGHGRANDGDAWEAAVSATFARAVDRIIALAPDLVVVGGDVFHHAKPSNNAILAAIAGFGRIAAALPSTPVVISAGNHDLSNVVTNACILRALEPLGVHIADRQAMRFYFADRDLSVLAVPDAPGVNRPSIVPDSRARRNVLVLHGEVAGMRLKGDRKADLEISHDEIAPARWDAVALGHYHCYTELAPNMWYAGSVDYTSSNPWSEISTPKGFVVRDIDAGTHEFIPVEPTRRYVDLPAIDATHLGAEDVDAAIAAAVDSAEIDDAVVRLKIYGITREVSHDLDLRQIKEFKKRALLFHLVEERPDRISADSRALLEAMNATPEPVSTPRERVTIAQRVDRHLETCELAPDVDRDRFRALGQHYMAQTDDSESPAAAATEAAAA